MPVAIITGASRGFGRALALNLANDGWSLVIDGRDPVRLREVGEQLAELGGSFTAIAGDVSSIDHGRPIRYGYVERPWPIEMYQNVYATEPGSAEMPSAGRPFTPEAVTALVAKGVGVAPLVLHTGVGSLEADELPYPERVIVPESTAEWVNVAHRGGHRVIAVGTTVVRALEAAGVGEGTVAAYDGWTDLVISADRGVRIVDGMITGWHEPASSHLMMLEAIAGRHLLQASYETALAEGYLWHEFGDTHLILP
jgi:S-adenosylmethionine:tRNA ribosyltransferase-isomerase